MAKALKIAAVVVGVTALAFTGIGLAAGLGFGAAAFGIGVSASTLFLIAGGLTLGATLLQKKPQVPGSQVDRLNASIDPRAPRKTVLGSTALATDVRYQEWYGANQEYCAWVVALASHRIQSVDQIWINDDLAWTSTGGPQGKFVGYFSVPNIVLEGSASTITVGTSGKWNGSCRLTGCAYAHLVFRTTGLSKKAESPFSSGIPSRITIIGKGAMLYDVRRDGTAGGSGPMRATDPTTWRYLADDGAEIGENLALLILRVLLGTKINGRLATGCGLPPKRLNLASFLVAANQCDELVGRSAGGTEPRYRGSGVLSEGDDPRTILDALCAACNGRLRDTGGRLSLVIMHNDLALAALDEGLTADDVVGPFTWNPDPSMESTPNVVRGKYTDASPNSLYQLLPYPDVSIPNNTGIERAMSLDLAVIESPSQAQRVAKQALQRKQYDRSFTAPFDIRAWKYPVGSPVPFTFPPLGFDRQIFRVAEQEVGPGGVCNMTLSFETDEIYRWDADDREPVRAAAPVVYDPTKAPLVQAIDDAAGGSLQQAIATSFPIGLTITAAADGTVTISDHIRRYTDGHSDVSVIGATISSGLGASEFRAIGYDDPGRYGAAILTGPDGQPFTGPDGQPLLGATPEYLLLTDDIDARASPNHPGRHYLGYFVIPTAGSPPSGGGGATPPGGRCVTTDTPILMADGSTKPAGDIVVGDRLRTRHELRLDEIAGGWGIYPVEAIEIADSADVWKAMVGGKLLRATGDHLVFTGTWQAMRDIGTPVLGTHQIVKMTVTDAHTYVSNSILSHNIKMNENEQLQ